MTPISRQICEVGVLTACAGVVLILMLVLSAPASAQSLLEFDQWMKLIEKRNLIVQRSLKTKDADKAIAAATEMRELYLRMEEYFIRKGAPQDAVNRTRQGIAQLGKLTKAATAGDFDSALASAIEVAVACRECHLEHKPLPQ